MKKILFSAVSALALAGVAVAADSTQFGILKVSSNQQKTIVSVPWLESSTGSSSVCVSNLVLTANLLAGDLLKVYHPDTKKYESWVLEKGTDNALYWKSVVETTESGSDNSGDPSETSVARGQAFILDRCGKPTEGTRDLTGGFFVMGKPTIVSAEDTKLAVSQDGSSLAYSLIAPPFTSDADINTSLTWSGLEKNKDYLYIPSVESANVVSIYKYSPTSGTWKDTTTGENGGVIKAGTGAWFVTKGTTARSVRWSAPVAK